jgi:hypothetical protein
MRKLALFPLCFLLRTGSSAQLNEWERQEEYNRRGHTWPPKRDEFSPQTEGWIKLYERRFKQLEYVDDPKKYQAYMHAVYSGIISECRFGSLQTLVLLLCNLKLVDLLTGSNR